MPYSCLIRLGKQVWAEARACPCRLFLPGLLKLVGITGTLGFGFRKLRKKPLNQKTMERDNLNARNIAGSDLFAGEVGKPGTKLNILGMEITPDDSKLRGATNRTGISGKTMLEQMSHQANLWVIDDSEEAPGPGNAPQGQSGEGHQATATSMADRSSWISQQEDADLRRQVEDTEYKGSVEE